ncbi:hypothetical protein PRZ48_005176 [Zasmidium cellare]|uniref:RING-type domain-containing protein n=1 Tax=Zasmidium cellare TaxID=395010 RepID=A0ABR0ERZ7_ZASCE|nr:hypothetical protein PRZ48_005176 [Zasmidium cellare]
MADRLPSSLKLHHSIEIEFPCEYLLKGGEDMVLLEPSRIEDRYKPLPLVPNDTIEKRYPWLNRSETTRQSYYPATSVFDADIFSEFSDDDDELEATDDLADDLERLSEYVGSSKLEVITYLPSNLDEDERPTCDCPIRVRICRTTLLKREDGEVEELPPAIYEYTVGYWNDISIDDALNQNWENDLFDIMHQVLDRDVRSVQFTLEDQGFDYDEEIDSDLWVPSRQMPIDQGIGKFATSLTKRELERYNNTLAHDDRLLECPSCFEDYDETDNRAVLLPCSTKHCMCFSCLEQWCIQNGLDKVSCPHCRQRLMPPKMAPQTMANYLDLSAPFTPDPQFTDYENAERSYASLDCIASIEDETLILIDHDLLIDAWNTIVPCGFDRNVPARLIPVKAPEAWFFFRSFLQTVKQHHGRTTTAQKLYRTLRLKVFEALRAEFIANGMDKFLNAGERARLEKRPELTPMRMDFRPFVEKSLDRIVQMAKKHGAVVSPEAGTDLAAETDKD